MATFAFVRANELNALLSTGEADVRRRQVEEELGGTQAPSLPAQLGNRLRFDDAERGFVYSVSRCYVRDEDAAEEVAQEAMLLAFRHRDAFRGESHPRTWLYRIAAMAALGYLRRQRRRDAQVTVTSCDPEELAGLDDPTARSAEEALVSRELADRLRCRLLELDEKYASVLRLRAEDLRDHQIAERLGISVAVVKIRAYRARAMLREVLRCDDTADGGVSARPAPGWNRSRRARACSSNTLRSGSR